MLEALRDCTYMVRHNPNCPMRFEVRLSGAGILMAKHGSKPHDDVGYGNTEDEAAANAIAARERRLSLIYWAPKFRELWDGLG